MSHKRVDTYEDICYDIGMGQHEASIGFHVDSEVCGLSCSSSWVAMGITNVFKSIKKKEL